jgi:hypothetical protein
MIMKLKEEARAHGGCSASENKNSERNQNTIRNGNIKQLFNPSMLKSFRVKVVRIPLP